MRSWARIRGYNPGTQSMSSYSSGDGPESAAVVCWHPAFSSLLLFTLVLLGMVFAADDAAQAASPWVEPCRALASKTLAITGPGAVALDLVNRSSLSRVDVASVRAALVGEFGGGGVHLAPGDRAAAGVVV